VFLFLSRFDLSVKFYTFDSSILDFVHVINLHIIIIIINVANCRLGTESHKHWFYDHFPYKVGFVFGP